ncbi:hypothetical protein CEUSTIGMA_g8666.t1 [Chlamydomonas eustigma]|uniref:Sulfotransferase n=1 Tax=Chlamydomonas eustigma TaxID=1157962 RepID=A0A250XDT8_9CHLO|nr:hypothetical protein CEUSTIGMA_g8666.t1 [Chlamydomonas eustigma]|eukprot:GAX81234.1 hypothetical protein CEUSTIGMA_g8666.t1 [Chlamydomonas eustigma]
MIIPYNCTGEITLALVFKLFYSLFLFVGVLFTAPAILGLEHVDDTCKSLLLKGRYNATGHSVADSSSSSVTSDLRIPQVIHHGMIRLVAVVGERHSGTTYLRNLLKANLDPVSHFVRDNFCSFKHFHQVKRDPCPDLNLTLAVVIFRNPYDWAMSMHQQCYCRKTNQEYQAYMENVTFSTFMTRDWIQDVYSELAQPPWRGPLTDPQSGKSYYSHIMQCRAIKIRSQLAIASWAPHVEFVRHEDILHPRDAHRWLSRLIAKYKLLPSKSRTLRPIFLYKGMEQERSFNAGKAMSESVWFNTSLLETNKTVREQVHLVTKMMDQTVEVQELCYGYLMSA